MLTDAFFIRLIHRGKSRKIALTFGCFFGQDVAFVSVLALNFPCAGKFEALFRARFGFHFRHITALYQLSFFRVEQHNHPFAFELRELFYSSVLFEFLRKFQEEDLAAFFKDDGSSFEKDIRLHFSSL